MEWSKKQRPGNKRGSLGAHFKDVPQDDRTRILRNLVGMKSDEAPRCKKPESNGCSRGVGFDNISHRPVPADGSHTQGFVELHGRPRLVRPQQIIIRGQGVEQRTGLRRSYGVQRAVMNVDHFDGVCSSSLPPRYRSNHAMT